MLIGPRWGKIARIWPQGRTKSGHDFRRSIWPLFLLTRELLGRSQDLVVVEHRAALVLRGWMHVAQHETNRAVTEDRSWRSKVTPLRHARCEGMPEVVEYKRECNSGFQGHCTDSVMRTVNLVMCCPGFRDDGKIHLELPFIRRARISRLSLVRSNVHRAEGDFPLVICN